MYNLFALENSKILKKMLKIAKSKKLWGSVKTERSIFVKNQSQVFPSHIMGFRNKNKKGKKTSYTFCFTRTLIAMIFFYKKYCIYIIDFLDLKWQKLKNIKILMFKRLLKEVCLAHFEYKFNAETLFENIQVSNPEYRSVGKLNQDKTFPTPTESELT